MPKVTTPYIPTATKPTAPSGASTANVGDPRAPKGNLKALLKARREAKNSPRVSPKVAKQPNSSSPSAKPSLPSDGGGESGRTDGGDGGVGAVLASAGAAAVDVEVVEANDKLVVLRAQLKALEEKKAAKMKLPTPKAAPLPPDFNA
jgi:hypothetical protein